MPEVKLNAADAAELAETLQFLSQWLARIPAPLAASLWPNFRTSTASPGRRPLTSCSRGIRERRGPKK